jgi:AcrR family transcriptional regulator
MTSPLPDDAVPETALEGPAALEAPAPPVPPAAPRRATPRVSRALSMGDDGAPLAAAAERILEAAARVLAERGATGLSMQDVAQGAGVSKGLIHYHYRDKDALLARLAAWLADGIERRERSALDGAAPAQAIDALWEWLEGELARGDVRGLLELATLREGDAPHAARAAAHRRRITSATTVASLYAALSLHPRVPAPMLAEVFVAFVDGLALQGAVVPDLDPRVAFDTFWLTVLSLAE